MNLRDSPQHREFEETTGRSLAFERHQFLADVRLAISHGKGFAAGKLGISEQCWLYYPILLHKDLSVAKRWVFERQLRWAFHNQAGLFPDDLQFCLSFASLFVEYVRQIDSLGLMLLLPQLEKEIFNEYGFSNKLIFYTLQHPDRSIPADEHNCYLPMFNGKRLLLVCPFADFLAQRAKPEIFERVWAKTGKRWFEPANIDSIEFPYGFEPTTQQRYASALDLLDEIIRQIESRSFDVALIGAGGLSIPLAARIKGMNKIAVSLGGHLQVLFGVLGKRWRDREQWRRDYINENWVALPTRYRPTQSAVCDYGDYW
jgi:hypothetical protein